MLKTLSLICIILSTIGCTSLIESSRRSNTEIQSQREAFVRAQALLKLGEIRAAQKALDRIANTRPLSQISVEAALLNSDVFLAHRKEKEAIEFLRAFERRARLENLDLTHIRRATERAQLLLKAEVATPQVPSIIPQPNVPQLPIAPNSEMQPKMVSDSIGVLLPLSGPFKIYGDRILMAMQISLGASQSYREDDALIFRNQEGLSLVVIDTQGQENVARAAVDRLVERYGVGIIVGDILTDTSMAIALQSKKHNIINLTLARKEGITQVGEKNYRLGVTTKMQVAALFSNENEKNLRRFGILYPENAFGIEMRDAFMNEARIRGMKVTKSVGYNPDATTFTSHIRQLVGNKKTSDNPVYEKCMQRASRISDTNAKKKIEKDCLDAVPPRVDFDALFIPDFPKNLAYIVPALIAEGVMVSQNPSMLNSYRRSAHLQDAEAIQLLGPSSWNSDSIGKKLGVQVDGALFVDNIAFTQSRERVAQFSSAFTQSMNSPPLFSDALAFDAIQILRELFAFMRQGSSIELESFSKNLQLVRHDGICGIISFDESRESVIPFGWFAFQDGEILQQ